MALNVGVNVIEVDGRASPTIQAAPTSIAALIGITQRGIPNRPVRITDLRQFREQFGIDRSDSYLGYALSGFFLNGGQEAFVVRVLRGDSTVASVTLNNRQTSTASPALRVSAGYRGQLDPGAWGRQLRLDVRDDARAVTQLQADTVANATSAQLVSLRGIQVGRVVRFLEGTTPLYRKITGIDSSNNTVSWSAASPIGAVLHQASAQVSTAEFRLIVRYRATPTDEFSVVEEWANLSMESDSPDYVVDRINQEFTGSRYITVADLSGTALSGEENPAIVSNQALTNGIDNAPGAVDYIGDPAQKTGFHAFDTVQVQLLAAPDVHWLGPTDRESTVLSALSYCQQRGDCMFVGTAPDRGASVAIPRSLSQYTQLESDYLNTVKAYATRFQGSKVYGALYAGWIQVNDPLGTAPLRFVPPDGHVMGIYARTERERGIWKAPAGTAAQVLGALDVSATFTDGEHTDLVRNGFINGIRRLPNVGIIVAASRTLSTDTRWWFVNVRLLFNFVKSSLREGLRFVRQEPHTEELRRSVRFNVVRPFLLGLWRQGAFGSDPPDQVFSIKCDAENNPPEEVNLGNFRLEVYFYPVKPVETIIITVGQQAIGAAARES